MYNLYRRNTMNAVKNINKSVANNTPAHIVAGAMSEADKQAAKSAFRPVTQKAMVDAIMDAASWSKQALDVELATGLVLFAENEGVSLATKKLLQAVYVEAGYKSENISDEHYKTVRRRIDASAALFVHIGHEEIVSWIGKAKDRNAIQKIVAQLEQYNFTGINSVLALVGKKPVVKPKQESLREQPKAIGKEEEIKTTANVRADEKEEQLASETAQMIGQAITQDRAARGRRASDVEGVATLKTEHLNLVIPLDIDKKELMEMSMKLLEYINAMQAKEAAVH
jgi:hypothetical protein